VITSTAEIILFLDFDGVLHHEDVFIHPINGILKGIYIMQSGRTLFEWMPILENLLKPYPDVAIVLSTSWVHSRSFSFAKTQLSESLQQRVIGATFDNRLMHEEDFLVQSRGLQIANDVERRKTNQWIALDDDDEGWPDWCLSNLIKTKGDTGLSDPRVRVELRKRLEQLHASSNLSPLKQSCGEWFGSHIFFREKHHKLIERMVRFFQIVLVLQIIAIAVACLYFW